MIVAIHQPEHLPYLGFFNKMSRCDIFVMLDDVQFTKNNFQNRNRVLSTNQKDLWLTVPVQTKGHTQNHIRDIVISRAGNWKKKYIKTIRQCYSKHPYFGRYFEAVEGIMNQEHTLLLDLNMAWIKFFRASLQIDNQVVFSSELNINSKKTDRLVDICKHLNATQYLSGDGAKAYLDERVFNEVDIDVRYQSFVHPEYPSKHFKPYLSCIDLLMNCGDESGSIVRSV